MRRCNNLVRLDIEIQTFEGKVYRQPNCRIKTTSNGSIMCLVREDGGSWQGVKGKVTINNFVIKKEYYIGGTKRIPNWVLKIFSVKI